MFRTELGSSTTGLPFIGDINGPSSDALKLLCPSSVRARRTCSGGPLGGGVWTTPPPLCTLILWILFRHTWVWHQKQGRKSGCSVSSYGHGCIAHRRTKQLCVSCRIISGCDIKLHLAKGKGTREAVHDQVFPEMWSAHSRVVVGGATIDLIEETLS